MALSPEFAHCWATIFAKSEELVLAVDAQRRILGVSAGFTRRFGTPQEDILGLVCANVAHEGGAVPETCPFCELILDGGQHAAEVHSDLLGGDFLVRVTPAVTEHGEVECAIHSFVEVTDQRRAEAELRISEARFASAQSVGRVGSWEYDPKTARFWGSAESRRIYGLDPESPTFSTEEVETITLDRERVHEALVDLISEGKEFDLEYEILPRGSSEPVSIWSVATVQRDEDGAPVTVLGVVQDITQRKKADDARRENEVRYRSLFEDSPVAMREQDDSAVKTHLEELVASGIDDVIAYLLADPQEYARCVELSRTLDANNAAVRLFEATSREELMARNVDLCRRESDRGICRFWAAMLAGERSATYEEANLSLKGKEVQVLETCTVVPGHEETFDRVYIADVDITEHKRADEALRESVARQERITAGMIVALSRSVEVRDPYTAGHERRVSELAAAIARELELGRETERRLAIVGMLHDLGKVTVPSEILSKPGRLSEVEFELIKGHPQAGYGILESIEFDFPVADIVVQHHERLDGSGYPAGLTGQEILPEARILAVADVAEAMISHRPYRAALPLDAALRELEDGAGSRYDAAACGAAVRLLREQGFVFSE